MKKQAAKRNRPMSTSVSQTNCWSSVVTFAFILVVASSSSSCCFFANAFVLVDSLQSVHTARRGYYQQTTKSRLDSHTAETTDNHLDFSPYLNSNLVNRLRHDMNITQLNAVQRQALDAFFDSTNNLQRLVVCSQTGSGKTMTFLLPILQVLHTDPTAHALVVAPTDLILDQHQAIAEMLDAEATQRIHFISSSRRRSSSTGTAMEETLQLPDTVQHSSIRLVAMDEVDAVLYSSNSNSSNNNKNSMDENTDLSPMGSLLLSRYASQAHFLGTTAFLSRAHQQTLLQRDFFTSSVEPLLLREPGAAQSQVLVPTLKLCYKYFAGDRIDKLLQVVGTNNNNNNGSNRPGGSTTLIFCGTVQQATEVYDALEQQQQEQSRGTTAIHLLHEELDPEKLRQLVTSLRTTTSSSSGGDTLLVATDIAARGLDIPNIQHVILVQVPVTVSSFVHQVGRTARQGQTGLLTALVHTASGDAQKYKHLHALKGATRLF